eukprot:898303-Pyramimonas_sp.AAC.1
MAWASIHHPSVPARRARGWLRGPRRGCGGPSASPRPGVAGAVRRACDWAAKSRSSERATLIQAPICEASVAEGLECAVA